MELSREIKGGEMIEQLKEQVKIVAKARLRTQEAVGARNASMAEWENENRELLDEFGKANAEMNEAEARLRELTLEAYSQTGDKSPALGVGIREVTKLEYDSNTAFDWAIEHRMALKLDVSAFEKVAKASPLDFVKVFQQPQATIASKLEEVIGENQD